MLVPPGKCFPRSLAILALRARIVIPPRLLAAFFSTFSFKVFSTLFSNLFCMLLSKVFSIFFAKVLSTLLCQRCLTFFAKVLSTLLFTLRKKNSLIMIKLRREYFDIEGISWAILTDPSKAFDCILGDLLMATLAAYRFDKQSLRVISFHSHRQQRTKINHAFSCYSKMCLKSFKKDSSGSLTLQYLKPCHIFF